MNKENVKITKRVHAFKGYGSSYYVEILNSFNAKLPLKDFFLFKFLFLFSLKNYDTNVKIKNIQKIFIQQTQNKTFKSKS